MTIQDSMAMLDAEPMRIMPPPVGRARPRELDRDTEARATILVVDDDASIAMLLAELLESVGYHAYTASNGRNALTIARAIHPELVLTDYQMPGLDGKQVIRALRTHPSTRDIPAVLMSSTRPHESALRDVPFLPKPFDIEDVLGVVEHHLGEPPAPASEGRT
jgi:CheY-like chemotaxis protein